MGWLFKSAEERMQDALQKGISAIQAGRRQDGVDLMIKALESSPQPSATVIAIANIGGGTCMLMWLKSKEPSKLAMAEVFFGMAARCAEAGIGSVESRYNAFSCMGYCMVIRGQYAEAEVLYKAALCVRLDPNGFTELGGIYRAIGNNVKAVCAWEEALELDPNHAAALENRARAKQEWGL